MILLAITLPFSQFKANFSGRLGANSKQRCSLKRWLYWFSTNSNTGHDVFKKTYFYENHGVHYLVAKWTQDFPELGQYTQFSHTSTMKLGSKGSKWRGDSC